MITELYEGIAPNDFALPCNFLLWAESCDDDKAALWTSFKSHPTELRRFASVFNTKYAGSRLIPFAYIHDLSGHYNDGWPVVACFDLSEACKVRIYDFAEPHNSPWINLSYGNFDDWLVVVQGENSRYKQELEELG